MAVIAYARGCWQDYVEHPWARKMVAGGIGVALAAIWIGPWFV